MDYGCHAKESLADNSSLPAHNPPSSFPLPFHRPSTSDSEYPPGISHELKRKFAHTHELFSRSIALWDDLEHHIGCSNRTLDEWMEFLKKNNNPSSLAYAGYLHSIKDHLELSKKRRHLEKPHQASLNRISPMRLIKRV